MRMSNSNTPRKFSEKIAILERKQNEENTTFEDIMRQVQSITHQPGESSGSSSTTAPMAIPQQASSGGLLPPQQPWGHNLGGSLPNVHQMPSYSPPQWPPNWQQGVPNRPIQGHRSRSPEDHMIGSASGSPSHHYHPYGVRANGRSPDRLPSHHQHYPQYDHPYNQPGQLVPPDSWNQINRARSDPAIHNMAGMVYNQHANQQMPIHHMPHFIQNAMPGPSGMMHSQSQQNSAQVTPQGSQQGSPLQSHQIPAPLQMGGSPMGNGMSPLQSPNHMMTPIYGYHNGSPLHSPMDSPHASTLMLDGSGTACMELSPPGMHDFNPADAGSLPNLQNHPQMQQVSDGYTNGCNGVGGGGGGGGYYHAPVGPRHSTGTCGPRLVPGPALTPESQSAPTSPHNQLDPNQPPMWPTRTFSNSPEALDIPKLTITNAEGAPGHHVVDCFNDLNELGLESLDNVLCNGTPTSSSSSQPPPNSFHDPGGPPMLHN